MWLSALNTKIYFYTISLTIYFTVAVMGVGVADPETIPTDVIFPNYNWPKLEQLKQQWNATTFVVLGTQMIKDLELLAGTLLN